MKTYLVTVRQMRDALRQWAADVVESPEEFDLSLDDPDQYADHAAPYLEQYLEAAGAEEVES